MCGLFGFIARTGQQPNVPTLMKVAQATEKRGRHAFGLAWLEASGKTSVFKRPGAASDRLADLERCERASIILGHCRYATHGAPADNRNNHPHRAGSGTIVHNGVIRNHEHLIRDYRLQPQTECDSEVLGLLIARGAGALPTRIARAISLCDGPLAMLGLWREPHRLILARRDNPLHFSSTDAGLYFGSLPDHLPGEVFELENHTLCVLTQSRRGLHAENYTLTA